MVPGCAEGVEIQNSWQSSCEPPTVFSRIWIDIAIIYDSNKYFTSIIYVSYVGNGMQFIKYGYIHKILSLCGFCIKCRKIWKFLSLCTAMDI